MARLILLGALLLNMGSLLVPSPVQADTLSLSSYRQLLRRSEFELRGLNTASPADRLTVLNAVQAALRNSTAIELLDGSIVPVNSGPLIQELSGPDPDLPTVIGKLHLLTDYLDRASETGAPPPQSVWADLDRVLHQHTNDPLYWLREGISNIQAFINQAIGRLLGFLFNPRLPGNPQIISVIVVLLGLGLLGGALWYFFRGYHRRLVQGESTPELDSEGEGEIFSASVARRRADELSQSGDFSRALRLLLLAALLALDEAGVFVFDRSLTNREYLRMVRSRPEIYKALNQIVGSFEAVWYGGITATNDEYTPCRNALDALLSSAPGKAPALATVPDAQGTVR